MEVLEKEEFFPVYKIINGKWTMGGLTYKDLSIKERKALAEHVSYWFKKD